MTEEQRDSILIEMSENLKCVNTVLNEHSKEFERINTVLNEHSKEFERINTVLNEHSKEFERINTVLDEHSKEFERINTVLDEHTEELVSQRQNMVKMEYNITDKLMALFDLGEVHQDQFNENDLRIKGMQNTLDWHNRRILKLENAE